MGSLFSRPEPQPQVGNVRPREASSANRAHEENFSRPQKRRRSQVTKRRKNRDVPPPTRAMNQATDAATTNDTLTIESAAPLTQSDRFLTAVPQGKRRKRKVAVFLGYIGEKYHGMQINPGVVTIEQVLLRAFHNAGLISDDNKGSLSKVHWMRAARTDKGVSAAGQCVSAKLECEVDKKIDPALTHLINQHLPEDVQVYGMLRATAGFNARADCHRRRYEYIFPVRLLGGCNGIEDDEGLGKGDPRCARLTSILARYEGTHCFANFTEGLTGSDDASRRYMISVRCGQPFLPRNSGVYYVAIQIYGQSFLLHQIRKMVGLALHVYLGHVPGEIIPVALSPLVKMPTPMAPALGLLLDGLVFDNYNKRFGATLDTEISVDAFAKVKRAFKLERIYAKIAERERLQRILESWVKTCHQKLSYSKEDIMAKHEKFVKTNLGREEQRKAYVASLYPITTSEDDFVNPSNESAREMANKLRLAFKERYDTAPTFLGRAPGRVNLIGEHLDYNGLPVITTAISQGTMVAGCLDNTEYVEVQHLEQSTYGNGRLRVDGLLMASEGNSKPDVDYDWTRYVSWGVKALSQNLPAKRTVAGGGRLLFCGDLPRAGGLASSSSLVTAAALAAARLNRKRFPKLDLALFAAEGERVGAGTRGGAVDHCVSMCGVHNGVLHISFTNHASVKELALPTGMALFAVDSRVKAEKSFDEYVRQQFNLRAAECRVAAAVLARRLDVHLEKSVTTPGQLLFQARKTSKLQCKDIKTLAKLVGGVMEERQIISTEDARRELEVSDAEWRNRFLMGVNAERFAVGKRISHVLAEAERVEQFADVLSDAALSDDQKVTDLASILNEGQESLKNLYETSCSQVDEVIAFCRRSGALGSRMTGAGWGGYTVNLVPSDKISKFLKCIHERFGKNTVFEVKPSSGACIFAIHSSYGAPERERNRDKRQSQGSRATT